MNKANCPKFESCSAALCPLDPHPRRYWYADTEICPLRNVPQWVKTQRRIQSFNPDPHRYFTQKMLESITRVTKDIAGIEYVGYSQAQEYEWLHARENRHRSCLLDQLLLENTSSKTSLNNVYNESADIKKPGKRSPVT